MGLKIHFQGESGFTATGDVFWVFNYVKVIGLVELRDVPIEIVNTACGAFDDDFVFVGDVYIIVNDI